MTEEYLSQLYFKVLESLRLVAAPAAEQLSSLPDFVCKPDEIALTFDEIMTYAIILLDNGKISDEQYVSLLEVNKTFDLYTKEDWEVKEMYTSKLWKSSRQCAIISLKTFNEIYKKPNLFWIQYIKNED